MSGVSPGTTGLVRRLCQRSVSEHAIRGGNQREGGGRDCEGNECDFKASHCGVVCGVSRQCGSHYIYGGACCQGSADEETIKRG